MPAAASCPNVAGFDRLAPVGATTDSVVDLPDVFDLADHLDVVLDPRDRRGIRHTLCSLLLIAAAAISAGCRSFVAIGEWAADAPQQVLAALRTRYDQRRDRYVPPDEATLRRALQNVDADAVDAAICAWLQERHARMPRGQGERPAPIAVDGKMLSGTGQTGSTGPVHLLAALELGTGTVLAQMQIPDKASEVPWFTPLLDRIDLRGRVVTGDALHTTAEHARDLHTRHADYVFTVKGNRGYLLHKLTGLSWVTGTSQSSTTAGHGRREHRTIEVLPVPAGVKFPHAAQVFRLHRHVTCTATGTTHTETVHGITSLATSPGQLADYIRGHWHIENRLHWVRDVTFNEDACRIRTGNAPRVMAGLRNLAISALRIAGHNNIAKGLRHIGRDHNRALTLLGIQRP